MERVNIRFPQPNLLYAGYSVNKLRRGKLVLRRYAFYALLLLRQSEKTVERGNRNKNNKFPRVDIKPIVIAFTVSH